MDLTARPRQLYLVCMVFAIGVAVLIGELGDSITLQLAALAFVGFVLPNGILGYLNERSADNTEPE